MHSLYYFAASTDSGCLIGCDHQHATVLSAAACIDTPAGFVMAVENQEMRPLDDREEGDFQLAAGHVRGEKAPALRIPLLKPSWR